MAQTQAPRYLNDPKVEIQIGDPVYLHYCGGTSYGEVIGINVRSIRVKRDDGAIDNWVIDDHVGKMGDKHLDTPITTNKLIKDITIMTVHEKIFDQFQTGIAEDVSYWLGWTSRSWYIGRTATGQIIKVRSGEVCTQAEMIKAGVGEHGQTWGDTIHAKRREIESTTPQIYVR